eukprot:TRINITY_DN1886_c0_g2_i1.p2 TRINITY_DN1886_c0_g2~~TRINITY_DN1886_c0_g2_i1.p2  ORF type:complete len:175 (-),score=64.03 TRINITY_DN1886_c0_g2_i1:215-739(-)
MAVVLPSGAKGSVKGVKGAFGGDKGWGKAAAPAWGKGFDKGWGGKGFDKGWGKGWEGGKGKFDDWGKGKFGGKDGGKGKGKGKKARGPSGPELPRTRISKEPVTGEVVKWMGKYGFIKPTIAVEHEKAAKHQGNIYCSSSDLVGGVTELTVGSLCQFHIFEDAGGLGAEECIGS